MYNVFIIRADRKIEHSRQPKAPDLAQLQRAVGGYIETVPHFHKFFIHGVEHKRGRAFANEEGLLKGLPVNANASYAWRKCFKYATTLVGDVVFYAKGQS